MERREIGCHHLPRGHRLRLGKGLVVGRRRDDVGLGRYPDVRRREGRDLYMWKYGGRLSTPSVEGKAGLASQPARASCQSVDAGPEAEGRAELDLALARGGLKGGCIGRSLWEAICYLGRDPVEHVGVRDDVERQVEVVERDPAAHEHAHHPAWLGLGLGLRLGSGSGLG